eukprot:CAMPEP_0115644896 /NCGR_PEP_ID=MMETSP0272-20121206/38121_1 /TAXON_ID=71861 /ORGANISM="Scrippsiella trochoidea, Strain CCMP3099" /LENGTH=71 /DNA_ID=CAMNT_0003082347 /DNA_START=152 /DNA_END=363 /DNA_ORIENTATION=+
MPDNYGCFDAGAQLETRSGVTPICNLSGDELFVLSAPRARCKISSAGRLQALPGDGSNLGSTARRAAGGWP